LNLVLTRLTTIGNAVIGRLDIPGLSEPLWTLEDAKEFIPAGEYHCGLHGWANEPVKIKKVWEVLNVPGRSAILFHAGNTDEDTRGCILVGFGVLQGKLISSADAIQKMRWTIGEHGFDLQIHTGVQI
jgi:hypothetical protein